MKGEENPVFLGILKEVVESCSRDGGEPEE